MQTTDLKALYEHDFAAWAEETAQLLEQRQFDQLDLLNLIEEVWDLSKRERDRLLSSLRLILHHLLKWQYQPVLRSDSWENTINRERLNIQSYLEDSPSLKRYLEPESVSKAYRLARLEAIKETRLTQKMFPEQCPFAIEQVLDLEFLPETYQKSHE
jgi:hypothetical protein